jgi:hypothetical protein
MDVVQTTSVMTTSHKVTCGPCGLAFRPSAKGQKFCSHDCFSASLRVSVADRFWSKVNKSAPGGCWLWTAATIRGYGQIAGTVNGARRPLYAHRVSWEMAHGPIPKGLEVLHNCPTGDNPLCVNPAHLFLGTQKENLADARRKGRLDESGARTRKLTYEDRLAIFNTPERRGVRVELARRYGVSKTAIHHIRAGRFAKPKDLRPVTHRQAS